MKVTEFFIGFGPRIWSFRRGETEYGIKAIPAGAYVKIVGMHNLDEFDPADDDRTYMSKPYWRRLSVAVAGSTMHFILALATLFTLFAFVGTPGGEHPGDAWVVAEGVEASSPAGAAGVRTGDRILSVDGEAIGTFEEFTAIVRARPGEDVPVVLERGAETLTIDVALAARRPDSAEAIGYFGVGPERPARETVGIGSAVGDTFQSFGRVTSDTFEGLGQVLSPSGLADLGSRVLSGPSTPAVEGDEGRPAPPRDPAADARPVSILGVADIGADLVRNDPTTFLFLFVILNVFIGVFNLVPLLPLDGGHVAIATYEKIRSLFRRGEPYHVDVVKLLPLTYAVVLVLVFLGISTIYLDIADPIGG